MFNFSSFTPETAPMRNSCDVLYEYGINGVSHANIIVTRSYEGGAVDFELHPGKWASALPKKIEEDT